MRVELIRATEKPEQIAALGARLCYSGLPFDELSARVDAESDGFLMEVIQSGHLSILEHASFTFYIEGASRVLLLQITRHRIASFSVQSQRYVSKEKGFDYVIPPSIAALGDGAAAEYKAQMKTIHGWYVGWQERLSKSGETKNEDARFVLPGACETRMIVTMNARELLHFFSLRCCARAQWEIRAVADQMLKAVYRQSPAMFQKAGPPCIAGHCSEGKRSCGKTETIRRHIMEIKGEKHAVWEK